MCTHDFRVGFLFAMSLACLLFWLPVFLVFFSIFFSLPSHILICIYIKPNAIVYYPFAHNVVFFVWNYRMDFCLFFSTLCIYFSVWDVVSMKWIKFAHTNFLFIIFEIFPIWFNEITRFSMLYICSQLSHFNHLLSMHSWTFQENDRFTHSILFLIRLTRNK